MISTQVTDRVVRIGTRASEVALRQARLVEAALGPAGVTCEIVTFKTAGDKKRKEPLSGAAVKRLFTHELEVALAKAKVDCCVHSLKDLSTESPDGLEIIARLAREDPRDVLVVNPVTQADSLEGVPAGSRIGASSLASRVQLLALRSDLEVVELRGNVPTRLRKVEAGQVHGAIFSAAALIRLEVKQRITAWLEPPGWLPPPGQGVIAIQVRSDDAEMRELAASLDHPPTSVATRAERAFLAALDGGYQAPVGALVLQDMVLYGFVGDINGRTVVRGSRPVSSSSPEKSGELLAAELRARGAGSLLAELRGADTVMLPQPE